MSICIDVQFIIGLKEKLSGIFFKESGILDPRSLPFRSSVQIMFKHAKVNHIQAKGRPERPPCVFSKANYSKYHLIRSTRECYCSNICP